MSAPEVVATCGKCGGEIYDNEYFGSDGYKMFCIDCIEDEWRDLTKSERIERMGYDVVKVAFPEDKVCCRECFLYKVTKEGRQTCGFNNTTVFYPNESIGINCPLLFEEVKTI